MRILVVDDSAMIRSMLGHSLKGWGYQPVAVDNIDKASQLILTENIQFVLTDWIMPGGTGPTLCRRIRDMELPYYVYIILITSLEGSQSLVEGIDAGADDFIHKPIKLEELHARIRAGERMLQLEHTLKERNDKLQEISRNLIAAQEIINRDLVLAGNMQRALLPTSSSSLQGVSIDGLFCPSSHVSGDIFNFFRLDEHHIGFYVADVAGHGVAAAMLSFTLSRLLTPDMSRGSPLKLKLSDPPFYEIVMPSSSVVEELNVQFQTDATHNILYFTMIYGVIDTRLHVIDICQAGHPNPIYLPKEGPAQFIGEGGFPVGITTLAEYESFRLNYNSGDRLFLYSDGITECSNGNNELFGADRLLMLVSDTRHLPINEVLKKIEAEISIWRGSNEFEDDVSMLVLEMLNNS